MVARAQQLQQEQNHPVAAALAAAAAASSAAAPSTTRGRRRTGGKGAAPRGDAGAVSAERDVVAAEGVEQQVRQVMAETGASLQQLQLLHAALGAQVASAE